MNRLARILREEGLTKAASSYRQMVESFGERRLRMTGKDRDRIESMYQKSLRFSQGDDEVFNAKMVSYARQMAKSIKAPDKAYRRAEAAANENFHDVAEVFYNRAYGLMGLPTPAAKRPSPAKRPPKPVVNPIVAEKESLIRQLEALLGSAVGQGTINLSQATKARGAMARAIA